MGVQLSVVFLIPCVAIGLSACVPGPSQLNRAPYVVHFKVPHKRFSKGAALQAAVRKNVNNPALYGGSDGYDQIQFKQALPWIYSQLPDQSQLSCSLKHLINLKVDVTRMYVSSDSQEVTGSLGMIVQYYKNNHLASTRHYFGNCEADFFSANESSAVQSCFKSVLKNIVPKITGEICRINSLKL